MITIVINRKTGESKIIDYYDDPKDNPWEATGALLAKMIIENGLLEKFKSESEISLNISGVQQVCN